MKHEEPAHHKGKKFCNPTLPDSEKSFFAGLKMWYTTKRTPWPDFVPNIAVPSLNQQPAENEIIITFVNHVTFLLQLPGLNILTDPMWGKRASPLSFAGPKRVRQPGVAIDDLPHIDIIIVSHNHYDHLDKHTLKILQKKFNPKIFVAQGDGALVRSLGFKEIIECDWWDTYQLDAATTLHFTPTQHWSARGIFDQYQSLWGSYVIARNNKKLYFGGDAGYSPYFNEIYQRLGAMDIALLGIGAYEPRWFMKNMHTNPDEAVQAHLDLHAKLSIGMHFGTFQLSAEAMQQPIQDLQVALQKYQVAASNFITMPEGATKLFNF